MMIISKKHLSRRTFLRGAGTALALPLLDAMTPALALAAPSRAAPARLAFMYVPNGIIDLNGEWTPSTEGRGWEFPRIMKSLEPFREHINVLSGLAQVQGRSLGSGGGDHARAGATWLTGVHPTKTQGVGIRAGTSADQLAARVLGQNTQLSSLELGLQDTNVVGGCDSGYSCAYTNTVSWRNPTTPMPMEQNPRTVFERLFGDTDTSDPAERLARLREQRTVLDFVLGDLARLTRSLGAEDRTKLDQYLEAIRDIERRIENAEAQKDEFAHVPVMQRPGGIPDTFEEHAKLMIDLQVLAFQSDLTRVITFMVAREGSERNYPGIGVTAGHHSSTHHQHNPERIANTIKINELHCQMFAYYLDRLKSTPDADGSLLDNIMLVYGSSLGDGNQHTHHDLPTIVAGHGAGRLTGGRHIRYERETPMNNLLISLLDKAGVPAEAIGDSTGPLPVREQANRDSASQLVELDVSPLSV